MPSNSRLIASTRESWHQMTFLSPEGRKEVLWVEEQAAPHSYRVLSAPVWIYGVSIGTVVYGLPGDSQYLRFVRVVRDSPGATIRFIVPDGTTASKVYLTRLLPDAKRLGLAVGPATFFDPPAVALHVRKRSAWWPAVGSYLNQLVREGVIEQWEIGDPDEHKGEPVEDVSERSDSVLIHPLPTDGADGEHVS